MTINCFQHKIQLKTLSPHNTTPIHASMLSKNSNPLSSFATHN